MAKPTTASDSNVLRGCPGVRGNFLVPSLINQTRVKLKFIGSDMTKVDVIIAAVIDIPEDPVASDKVLDVIEVHGVGYRVNHYPGVPVVTISDARFVVVSVDDVMPISRRRPLDRDSTITI